MYNLNVCFVFHTRIVRVVVTCITYMQCRWSLLYAFFGDTLASSLNIQIIFFLCFLCGFCLFVFRKDIGVSVCVCV